uniref:FeoA family protein n=1 Tax=Thaumasiovibrio occultus TaxID=1891184 RepID=UPI000B34B401|nr:FeoA family protein [Thaumasiovibrio occultus]
MFWFGKKKKDQNQAKTLFGAALNIEHKIKSISQSDQNVARFLSTLGCFEGESITIISILSDTYVVNIKDARYSIDADLAKTIVLH